MDKIIPFPGVTRLGADPDQVLEEAKGELTDVVIIGQHKDGGEFFYSNLPDGPQALWLLKRLEKALLEVPDRDE